MPTLTFEESKESVPIAIIKGGDLDKEIVFLNIDDIPNKKKIKSNISQIKYEKDLKQLKLSPNQRVILINKLQEAKNKNINPNQLIENETIKKLYEKILNDEKNDKSIVLPDDSFFELLVPSNPESRTVWYITGASGSGKSFIARGLAEKYKKMFPDRQIYLISKLLEDSTLDNMKPEPPKRIKVQTLIDDYPSLNEFKDCMIIFDDYDTFDGPLQKVVQQLIDDLAIQGRHTNTTMLCLTHYLTNYKKTRLLMNESTHFVVYPQSTSSNALKYLLTHHLGLDKDQIQELKKLGRWVCLGKNYPQYLISEHQCKLLHE